MNSYILTYYMGFIKQIIIESWLRYNIVYNIINFLTNSISKYMKFNNKTYILSYIGSR